MKLTNRELEIMTLMAKGFLNKEIAEKLKISSRTAEAYIRRIYIKLRARNRANAVFIFIKNKKREIFNTVFLSHLLFISFC